MEFSSNLISGIELTFDDLVVISNSLINAMEHCKNYLSDPALDKSVQTEISNDLSSFSVMREKIVKYLSENGLTVSDQKIVE